MQIHWSLLVSAFIAIGSAACDHGNANNNTTTQNNTTSTGGSNEDASTAASTGPCEATACGPQAETARVCADGTSVGSTCTRNAAGTCEWQFDCAGHDTPAATADAGATTAGADTSATADAGATAASATPDAGAAATGRRRRAH